MKRQMIQFVLLAAIGCGGPETVPIEDACDRYIAARCSLWERCGVLDVALAHYGATVEECRGQRGACFGAFGMGSANDPSECVAEDVDSCIETISFGTTCDEGSTALPSPVCDVSCD